MSPNVPFHSASLSDYDVYALLTRRSHYIRLNLYSTSTTVVTIFLSSNTFTTAIVLIHSNPLSPHPTHPVVFLLSSHTTQPFALYHPSFTNISAFSPPPNTAPISLNVHLLLPFDVSTTSATY